MAAIVALGVTHFALGASGGESAQSHNLQQEHLHDTLRLELQQRAPAARADVPHDAAQRLQHLHARQRVEQQELQQRQFLEQEGAHHTDSAAVKQRERLFRGERELQLQRFDREQRQLLQSTHPSALEHRDGLR